MNTTTMFGLSSAWTVDDSRQKAANAKNNLVRLIDFFPLLKFLTKGPAFAVAQGVYQIGDV
jgi:hypothetical protein